MKDATPISAGSAAALSARITAVLGPLDDDEQACCEKLEELGQKVKELQEQISEAETNLRIIKDSKVDAIRALMGEDPLLARAFGADRASSSTVQEAVEAVEEAEEVEAAVVVEEDDDDDDDSDIVEATDAGDDGEDADGNPLLKMDD